MVIYAVLLAIHGITLGAAIFAFFLVSLPLSLVFIFLEMTRPATTLRRWNIQESAWQIAKLCLDSFVLGYVLVAAVWWVAARALAPIVDGPLIESDWLGVGAAILILDFFYYWWHRLVLHGRRQRVRGARWLRRKHAVHHDVRDLDLFRGNTFSLWDAFCSHQLPLALICAGFGISLPATLVAFSFTMFGFSSHHVNHTLHLGPLRYLLMDNHAHKLHHCRGGGAVNHGNFFSIWDRMFGTYYEDWSRCATQMHANGVRVDPRRRCA